MSTPASVNSIESSIKIGPNIWIRNGRRTLFVSALTLIMVSPWVAMFVVFTVLDANPRLTTSVGEKLSTGLFFLGVAALHVYFAARMARSGVLMTPDRVVVRGPLWTHTIALKDVKGVEPGVQPGFGNGTPCPALRRSHGRPVYVWALGREGWVFRYRRYSAELQPLCGQLQRLVENLRTSHDEAI